MSIFIKQNSEAEDFIPYQDHYKLSEERLNKPYCNKITIEYIKIYKKYI